MAVIFSRREWDGRVLELGDVWRLRKGTHIARAVIVTHPLGVELRLEIDGHQEPQTQAFRMRDDDDRLLDLAAGWR